MRRITTGRLGSQVGDIIRNDGIGKAGSCHHLFRHTFAMSLLENGCDVCHVQAMLGHSKLETTAICTRVSMKVLKEAHSRCHPARLLSSFLVASSCAAWKPHLRDYTPDPGLHPIHKSATLGDMKKPHRPTAKKARLVEKAGRRSKPGLPGAASRQEAKLCPVVGVGASAGGLEAFAQLLRYLPKRSGLAFALVQHLDPTRESHLSEILSRSTEMPVVEARDGVRLEPDHVYVIPPNASMQVSDGSLSLGEREKGIGQHLTIDHFFTSLALDCGNKAIGVVLSGNASDGTLGLKAIKAAGGIAFAQDEASAKFPGMPRSAIGAGVVDFVLPPEQIAAELVRLGAAPYLQADKDAVGEADTGDGLRKILKLLRTATGVDFGSYRQTTIQRRIQRRLTVGRIETLKDYLLLLEANPDEAQALFGDILIHVTNFFREPECFDLLKTRVFPELLQYRRPEQPIRIWVPGCSTGEEAYSLAMSLIEVLGEKTDAVPIQIFGTDVSESVIDTARRGVYEAGIEADVSPERLRRFFTKVDRGYRVNKGVRDLCVFARQNVIKDPPFSKLDLITCRNVLIYFEPEQQKKLIPIFHYALKPHGWLLLGSAETIGSFGDLFTTFDAKHRVFLKRDDGRRSVPHSRTDANPPAAQADPPDTGVKARPEIWSQLDVLKEADRRVSEKYCPPGLVINDAMEIVQFRGEVGPYLNPGSGEASLNLFKMTRPSFATELRSAITAACKGGTRGRRHRVHVDLGGRPREVFLEVLRMDPPAVKEQAFVVLFDEAPPAPAEPAKASRREETRSAVLAEELAAAKEHLQTLAEEHEATNEELRSANEEIQSSNEELQSTNEELETAKEELQSTNEELRTVNDELHHINADLAAANDDLNNLFRGVNLPVIMLGRDLRIRRFTPATQKLFKLVGSDVGRLVADIKADIEVPDLAKLVREVIDGLCVKERELRDAEGRWHRLQVRPYETTDNKIAGAVLIFFEIDEAKRAGEKLKHLANYADAIIETAPAALLVLDADLRVKRVTGAFCAQFRVAAESVEGQLLYDLGNRQWDIPPLRSLLEKVLPRNKRVSDFKVEHVFPKIGKKTMLLNARRIVATEGEKPLIVLAITELPS